MREPRATILVMVYRNADALEPTVESILELSMEDVEIILSDDGSPEQPRALLEEAAERLRTKYPRVRMNMNSQNLGTVKHFNRLVQMAEGEYIVPCSAGDRFCDSDTLGELLREMEKKGERILTARHRDVYPDHSRIRPGRWLGGMLRLTPRLLLHYMITKRNPISGCATIYTKSLFTAYGSCDEDYRLMEDFPYFIMLLQRGERIPYRHRLYTEHKMGGVSNGAVHPAIYEDIRTLRRKLLAMPEGLPRQTLRYLRRVYAEEKETA